MAVSIVCTGYAAWVTVRPQTHTTLGDEAGFGVFDTSQRYYTDYGVTIATSGADGASYKGFATHTVTGSTGTKYVFSNTTLSIVLLVDMETLSTAHDGSYRGECLVLTCRAKSNYSTPTFAYVEKGEAGIGNVLTAPEKATLEPYGYPSYTREVDLIINADGELEIEIPLQMLYDLLATCEQATTPSVVVNIPFTPTAEFYNAPNVDVTNILAYEYYFSGRLKAYQ